jgi:hypothetical protein
LTLLLNDAAISESGPEQCVQSPESGIILRESHIFNLTSPHDPRDQQRKLEPFPADDVLNSNVYQKNKGDHSDAFGDKRFSSATSISSAGSMAYVMSSPQIITPADQGVQRLQLQQSKAQLIRVTGLQSNAEKDAKERGKSCEARIRNPQSADFSMMDYSIVDEDEEDEEEEGKTGLSYRSSMPLSSPRSQRHSNVPEEVGQEGEDEMVGGQQETSIRRTGNFPEFDEVRLQYELAKYPFKEAEVAGGGSPQESSSSTSISPLLHACTNPR